MVQITKREEALQLARTWIGTPYKHQAMKKGLGCDCAGLVMGIWNELYGRPPKDFVLPPYTASWAEETGLQLMVDAGNKYFTQVPISEMLPGDVIMYRMYSKGPTKHSGILASPNTMIHAYNHHNVMESGLINNKGSQLTHVFRFPEDPILQ